MEENRLDIHISRTLVSVRPERSHCLSMYSYALSANAPTESISMHTISKDIDKT